MFSPRDSPKEGATAGSGFAESLALFLLAALVFGQPGMQILVPVIVSAIGLAALGGWAMREGQWWVALLGSILGASFGAPWFAERPIRVVSIVLAIACFIIVKRCRGRVVPWAVASTGVAGVVASVFLFPEGTLDVGLLHDRAADAVLEGRTPWSGLDVPSGVVGAGPQERFDGYPYPPATLGVYTMGRLLFGDARAIGWVLWLALLALGSWLAHDERRRRAGAVLALGAVYPLMIWTGWTELLTLLGFVVVALGGPMVAALALGFTLATKQYLIVAVPLVLAFAGWRNDLLRWVVLGVAAGITASGFLLGNGFVESVIGEHTGASVRPSAYTLYGALGASFDLPHWIGWAALAVSLVVASFFARRGIHDRPAFFRALAVSLTVLFALAPFAHANHWFMVWGLILVSRICVTREGVPKQVTSV